MNTESNSFEWNDAKAAINLQKHGVSFEEAKTVFEDVHAFVQEDDLHSDQEPRAALIGYSNRNRILIVFFSHRPDNVIRIISARKATPRERKVYENASRS